MALIDPEAEYHADIPDEPGQWVVYRPLTAADLEDLANAGKASNTSSLIAQALKAWSYEPAPSADMVRRLDAKTFNWLTTLVSQGSGLRTELEKKDSEPPSSATSVQEPADSPPSSDT